MRTLLISKSNRQWMINSPNSWKLLLPGINFSWCFFLLFENSTISPNLTNAVILCLLNRNAIENLTSFLGFLTPISQWNIFSKFRVRGWLVPKKKLCVSRKTVFDELKPKKAGIFFCFFWFFQDLKLKILNKQNRPTVFLENWT
jgi:hypothetical protein